MKKYISFGNYNKLYKHIWLYIMTKYICDYVLGNILEKKASDFIDFPRDILIQQELAQYFYFFMKRNKKKNVKEI